MDLGNLRYHVKAVHFKQGKKKNIMCTHKDCLLKFKTDKQKSFHHETAESECYNETLLLVNLVIKSQKFLTKLNSQNEITNLINSLKYSKIKELYDNILSQFLKLRKDNFHSLMINELP